MDSFAGYHPLVNFIYFLLILVFTMFSMHPFFLVVSIVCAFIYSCMLDGVKALKRNIFFMLPITILGMILNPLFTQRGATILFYLNDAAVTLEAVIYGGAAALMFSSVFIWIQCFSKVMSTDKFICLFGKFIPAIALVLSITFRFIPLLKMRFSQVQEGQRCLGRSYAGKHPVRKIKILGKELSILIAWSLEAGIETSDSMEARGYGLKGRSNYSVYRFDKRDAFLTGLILVLGGIVFAGCLKKVNSILYYPQIIFREQTWFSFVVYGTYIGLCLLPIIIEILGELKWKRLYSNM